MQTELQLPVSQNLALLAKIIRKITKRLIEIRKAEISSEMLLPSPAIPKLRVENFANETTMTATIEKGLDEAGNDALRERQKELLSSLDLSKFVIILH